MKKDILSLYETEELSVMFVSEPGYNEPYYTFKVGENHTDHFVTLDWFHVYIQPEYEIQIYNPITDNDMKLTDWMKQKGFKENKCNQYVHLAKWTKIPNISLPEITTNSLHEKSTHEINQNIRDFYNGFLTQEYLSMKGKEGGHGPESSYQCQINGNILSIIIEYDKAGFNTLNYKYKIYNINLSTGKEVTNTDLLEIKKITIQDIVKVIQASNNHKIHFSEGTIVYDSLINNPMCLLKNQLIVYLKVENLPYGDGTYVLPMPIKYWLNKIGPTQQDNLLEGIIAIPNTTGSKILVAASAVKNEENKIKSLTHAIYKSKAYPIKYIGKYDGGKEFHNLSGYLFENEKKQFQTDEPVNGSVFLCNSSFLQKNQLITFTNIYEDVDKPICNTIEKEYGRKISQATIMIAFGDEGEYQLCEIIFKNDEKEKLALYTLCSGQGLSYLEFPQNQPGENNIWDIDHNGKPFLDLHLVSSIFKSEDGYLFIMDNIQKQYMNTYFLRQKGKKLIQTNSSRISFSQEISQSSYKIQPSQVVSQTNECMQPEGIFKKHTNPVLGIYAEVQNGKVFLRFEKEKLLNFWNRNDLIDKIQNETYEIKGLTANCKGIFVADIGQNINPTLCMLMENGTVEILNIPTTLFNKAGELDFTSSGPLPNLQDIVAFHFGGGGEYEEDGEKMYSYVTIYGIDKNGIEHEIEPSYLEGIYEYKSIKDNKIYQLYLSSDWKIIYTIKEGNGKTIQQYRGIFREISHDKNFNNFDLSYQFTYPNLEKGFITINAENNEIWTITTHSGIPLGNQSGSRVTFKIIN